MRRGGRALAVLLSLAAACGGNGGSGAGRGDYFTQLERVSETAHIQDHGLRRDLRARLKQASGSDERLNALVVYVDQSARLYQDVVDALRDLQPADGLISPHQGYLASWQAQLDLILTVRDAGFDTSTGYLDNLQSGAFREATAVTRTRCEELQAAVIAGGRQVDLACGGGSP